MTDFLTTVRSLGVSLNVYKVGEKLEWTSLLGGEKRLLLNKLPEKFDRFLPPSKVEKTRSLWIVSIIWLHHIVKNIHFIKTAHFKLKHTVLCSPGLHIQITVGPTKTTDLVWHMSFHLFNRISGSSLMTWTATILTWMMVQINLEKVRRQKQQYIYKQFFKLH